MGIWVLGVLKNMFLRLADHSSREVLPNVVGLSVISEPQESRGPGLLETVAQRKEIDQCVALRN
jgi:hypothetical protein